MHPESLLQLQLSADPVCQYQCHAPQYKYRSSPWPICKRIVKNNKKNGGVEESNNFVLNSLCANRQCIVDIVSRSCANRRCIVDIRTNVCFAIDSPVMKLFKFPMRDNSKYIISHSYTKISQTETQFPMHPLKTICTVKMAWHNRGKCSGTQ